MGNFGFENPALHGQKPIQHNSPQTVQLTERASVASWNLSYMIVEEELRRQNVGSSLAPSCLMLIVR